jgi:hypothetical protein
LKIASKEMAPIDAIINPCGDKIEPYNCGNNGGTYSSMDQIGVLNE